MITHFIPDLICTHIAVFYGGVIDLEEFAKLSSLNGLKDLIKIEAQIQKEHGKKSRFKNRDDEEPEEEDEEDTDEGNRQRNTKNKSPSPSSLDVRRKKKDRRRKKPNRQDYDFEDVHEDEEIEDLEDDDSFKTSSGLTSSQNANKKMHSAKKRGSLTTTTTTTTTVGPPVMIPNPYYPYPYFGYHPAFPSQIAPVNPSDVSGASKKKDHSKSSEQTQEEETVASPSENHNVINVNLLPDVLKGPSGEKSSLLSSFASSLQEDNHLTHNREPFKHGSRRVSFGNMANGLIQRALRSMVYRVFPSIKNVKGVAARGCREVQSIGSFDSIIMPLGLAVTLHPLLLPLIPFLLLALGSIKAIESATCFVSEYFR